MKHIKLFEQFLNEAVSGEIFKPKREEWVKIKAEDHPELSNEFFDLIHTAYQEIGGHAKVKSPSDVFKDPDWTYWKGVDIHGSPDLDLIVIGKETRYGIKYVGVGHDGTKDSKKKYLESRGEDLNKLGYFAEVSGKLALILIDKYHVPTVDDKAEVEKVLGKPVEWHGKSEDPDMPGDGWYERVIGGEKHEKILVGRPKI